MKRGIALLAARFISNPYRDSFAVRLGARAILLKFGITGKLADAISYPLRLMIGFIMETGVFHIDLAIDTLKLGMQLREFRKIATKAYLDAKKGVLDLEEKERIRNEYRKALRLIGPIISG